MIFSYPQFFPGLRDWLTPESSALRVAWAVLGVLTLPIMFWAGNHFYTGMWQALKHRQANMHALIAFGISAAWLYSTVAVLVPQIFPTQELAQTFYDVTAVVVALVNLGLVLELRAKGRTSEAIKKLIGLQAKTARVMRDGVEIDIPFEEVLVGDTVVVRPGEKHFRFIGERVRVIYDWDSLTLEKEPIIVGHASSYFTYTEEFGEYQLPTEEEGRAFVAEYEAAHGRPFTREEYQTLKAAKIYGLAYGARCEHALHPHETIYPEGSCRAFLAWYRSISPIAE